MPFTHDPNEPVQPAYPRLLVSLSLPEICTYSSPEPPLLTVSLSTDSDRPVTIRQWLINDHRLSLGSFTRHDAQTGERLYEYRVDACHRRLTSPPSLLNDRFYITIPANQSYAFTIPFRCEHSKPHTDAGLPGSNSQPRVARYRLKLSNAIGMGGLKIGNEYIVRLKDDLKIGWWKYGTREELVMMEATECDDLVSDGKALVLESQNEARFRVET